MNQRIAACLFVLFQCVCPSQLRAAPLMEIIALKWCGSIASDSDPQKDKEPVDVYENDSTFRGRKLYLWMKVKGGQEALNALRQGRKIHIIQRWKYQRYGWHAETIDVSFGGDGFSADIISKLQQEIDQRGYFDWRTWGTKENLKATKYNADFVDAFYDPLGCALPQGCAVRIQVR